jgi:hypothetical protein
MDLFWIYDLPNSLMGILIVSIFIGLSLLGLLASRRWFALLPEEERGPHNDLVSYFLAAIGAIYGITIGLLAAGTWSAFSDVEATTIAEAASLAALYRDVSGLSQPHRDALQQVLKEHAHFEIEKQWPAHRHGKVLPSITLMAFQNALLQVQPKGDSDKIIFSEAFRQFNHYVEQRRMRISNVSSGIPSTLWYVVLLSAGLTVCVVWFFQVPSFRLHAAMTSILSGLIGLLAFVIAAMDWPYRGEFSVSPDALQNVLETTMNDSAAPPASTDVH